ncbi:Transcription elongation factor 1 [Penicillium angulare]|uniref:Transcription elongation factor 1 n=1 Tax=Penicillium angulare TaxID=116970 RepID=UPI00253FC8AA|nr:Transcription elongation factor 1 [Penicillium angulare]KAJ5263733.1 Transcription elongation factor 1 [Penicillium angulare]
MRYPIDLSAAVDVYSDWVDACDAVAKDTANQYDGPGGSQVTASKQGISADTAPGDNFDDGDY